MSHKEEAKKILKDVEITLEIASDWQIKNEEVIADRYNKYAEIEALQAQTHATLALVEAQEAANEQLRIANLIALGAFDTDDGAYNRAIIRQYPEIAKTLGIEEQE